MKLYEWKSVCNTVKYKNLLIQCNFATQESFEKGLKENKDNNICFISDGEDPSPIVYQGYNLEETKAIRDYLTYLINYSEDIINNN